MRVVLTIIAVALVTLLTAALIVPYFVDWSAHRSEVAERLQGLVGGPVALTGPVTLRLLPTPYLEVGAGSAAGAGPDAPRLTFEAARLELALVKLASGAFRFTDVRLEKPVLTVSRTAGGALILPTAATTSTAVGFDRFSVADGTIRLAPKNGGPDRTISGIELDGDAATLAGPYHLSGRAAGPGGVPIDFRLVSEKAGPTGAPVRVAVNAGSGWPRLEFDGTIASGPKGPSALGDAVITGTSPGPDGPAPWRASGRLAADLDGAMLTGAEFRFGPEERALRAEGSLALAHRDGTRLTIDAKAKQANLDALLRRKGEDGAPPARAVALLSGALAPALAGIGPITLDARFAVETAILGGDTLTGLGATLRERPDAPLAIRLDVNLPGKSHLKAEGEVESGAAAEFSGMVDFAADDPAGLVQWASQGSPELGAWASALPPSSLAVTGAIKAAAVGFSGKALKIAVGRSVLTGSVAVTRPVAADPGRIYADLAADSLDVDALPSLSSARSLAAGYDLSLSFDARNLRVAHFGEAGIDGASMVLKVSRNGPKLTLDRLAFAGLGGASLDATGSIGPDGAVAKGRLDARDLAEFAGLVSRVTPAPWSRALAARATVLSPASITFEAHGGPPSEGASTLQSLTATGTLARTSISVTLDPAARGDGQSLALDLHSPDSGALLRQLDLGGGATRTGKEGRLELHASGAWESGFDVDAGASLSGVDLTGRGRYLPTAEGDDARLFGSLKIVGENVAPLASILGLAPPGGSIGPVDASADVTLRGDRWNVSHIAATIAGVKTGGILDYEPPPAEGIEPATEQDLSRAEEAASGPAAAAPPTPAAISGELSFDRLRLEDLAALALGPQQPAGSGKLWSNAKFAAFPLTLPPAAVQVNVRTLSLPGGLSAQGFSTRLRLSNGRLDLGDVAMKLNGGAVSGRATLRRSGENATLDGSLAVEPPFLKLPGFSGRLEGTLSFASTGTSVAALIAGLAGNGTVNFTGATLPRSDPDAVGLVVAGAQSAEAQIDETNVAYRFGQALDKGPLPIPDGAAPVALTAGTMRVGPLPIIRPNGEATFSAGLDLTRMALETKVALTAPTTGLKFWSGPPPSATVTVEGQLDTPKRRPAPRVGHAAHKRSEPARSAPAVMRATLCRGLHERAQPGKAVRVHEACRHQLAQSVLKFHT